MDISPNSVAADLLGGRYRLGDVIGRGGMSAVYAATDTNLGREVALKLFAPESADPDELRRQEAEIELLAALNHPNLVTLFDAGLDDRLPDEPRPFLTMELVEGQDLRTRIRLTPLSLNELAVVGAGVADALAYVHALGIIHRDIKPANILLVPGRPGEPLRPKLTDFGIARVIDDTRLTATGTMVGTAAYLSPEQARGADLGPASDIYSLGLVLLECLKGEVEYPGSAVESAVARLHRSPSIPESVPADWAHLFRSMTALDPLDRPGAADVATALRQALISPQSLPGVLAEEQTRVLPVPPARPPRPPMLLPENDAELRPLPQLDPDAAEAPVTPQAPRRPRTGAASFGARTVMRFRKARSRTRAALVLALLAVLTALTVGATVIPSLVVPEAPAVVPYPTVTGSLGEHLSDLQKSVQP